MTDWMHLDAKVKPHFCTCSFTQTEEKIGVVFLQYNDAWWLILPSSCPTFASRTLRFPPYLICMANTSACCHQEPRAAEVICLFQAWSFRSPWISWIGRLSSANWVDDLFQKDIQTTYHLSISHCIHLWGFQHDHETHCGSYRTPYYDGSYYQGQKTNEVKLTTWMLWTASWLSQAAMAWRNATPSQQSHSPCPPWRFQPLPFGPQNQSKTLEQIEQRKCSSPPHLFSCLATIGWGFHFFQPEAGTVKDSVLAWVSSSTKTMLIYDACTPANWFEGKVSCLETLPVRLRSRHRTKADHFCQAATRTASSKSAATDLTNSNSQIKTCHLTLVKSELELKRIYAPCLYCTCFPESMAWINQTSLAQLSTSQTSVARFPCVSRSRGQHPVASEHIWTPYFLDQAARSCAVPWWSWVPVLDQHVRRPGQTNSKTLRSNHVRLRRKVKERDQLDSLVRYTIYIYVSSFTYELKEPCSVPFYWLAGYWFPEWFQTAPMSPCPPYIHK